MEVMMMLCFGVSWPISIHKSRTSRTARGKSVIFEYFILIGYAFGIARKFLQITAGAGNGWLFWLSLGFYFLNSAAVITDVALYYRNRRFDRFATELYH